MKSTSARGSILPEQVKILQVLHVSELTCEQEESRAVSVYFMVVNMLKSESHSQYLSYFQSNCLVVEKKSLQTPSNLYFSLEM